MLLRKISQAAAPLCRSSVGGASHSWASQTAVRSLSSAPGSSGMRRLALLSQSNAHVTHFSLDLRRRWSNLSSVRESQPYTATG